MKYEDEELGLKKSHQVVITADLRVHDSSGTLSIDFICTVLWSRIWRSLSTPNVLYCTERATVDHVIYETFCPPFNRTPENGV